MPEMPSHNVLLSEEQIQSRIDELAKEISEDYTGQSLLLLGVLKGSLHFLSDLARRIEVETEIDFVQVSSYGEGTESSGIVRIKKDLDNSIEGRHVLIVEDILDTGLTLKHLRELLGTRKPASLKVVTLLRKPEALQHGAHAEYVGFDIENRFVVGYGLDHGERFRNLPYVAELNQ